MMHFTSSRKIILLGFACLFMHLSLSIKAQDNVGIGTNTPDASAILEMQSTTKGLLIPRMNTVAMTAIPNPVNSLLVFNTDSMCYFFYRLPSLTWISLCYTGTGGSGGNGTTGATGGQGYSCWDTNQNGVNDPSEDVDANGVWNVNDCNAGVPVPGTIGATGATGVGVPGATGSAGPAGGVGPTGPGGSGGCSTADMVLKSNGSSSVCSRIKDDGTYAGVTNTLLDFWTVDQGGASFGLAGNNRVLIGWYVGSDPLIEPTTDWWGYCGRNTQAWYEGWSYGWYTSSTRDKKKDITPISGNKPLEEYVMNDIDKIQPSFYMYKNEPDNMVAGMENKYRPQMHLGAIVDESPDYIKDQTFSGIDNYGMATLAMAGVKYNRAEIKKLQKTVSDFGSSQLNTEELYVDFSEEFANKIALNSTIPVVTITSNNPAVVLSVRKKTNKGFYVVASKSVTGLSFDWIAMAKVANAEATENAIPAHLKDQLNVPESTKNMLFEYYKKLNPTPSPKK